MSNNDGAAVAQYMAVGEELSRAMVEVEHLREENERLREALQRLAELDGFVCGKPNTIEGIINYTQFVARAALGEKE